MELLIQILLTMTVIFALARIGSTVFGKLGLPGLIGEIIVGVILANVAGGAFLHDVLALDVENRNTEYNIIYILAELGVIFLLFSVGLETKVKDLLGSGKSAFFCAFLGVVLPFVAGLSLILAVGGYDMNSAMFMGAAMVATSVGITARIIKDMKLMDVKESRIIIAAAVIDDVLGMVVLAIVKGMASGEGDLEILDIVIIVVKAVAFVLAAIAFAKWCVPRIYNYLDGRNRRIIASGKVPYSFNKLIFAIIVCLGMAYLAEYIGLAAIIGAFLAGMMFADYAWEWDLEHKIESITTFLITFFFVNVGLQVDISAMSSTSVILLTAGILVLALLTKYIGCGLGAKIGDKSIDKSSFNIIGVGMMPRGEVGIIIASIGLHTIVNGESVMDPELYGVVVMMSVITTIVAPPLLSILFKKKYKEEYTIMADDKL